MTTTNGDALEVVALGPEARGGTAVVMLHGWGAPGDDLVGLGEVLARPGVRFYFPAGPLPEIGGGRAWWPLEGEGVIRPPHAYDDAIDPALVPHGQVGVARRAIQALLTHIKAEQQPQEIVLGGFSQGAMLAIDVALAGAPPVDKVFALSGVLLADSLPALHATRTRPRVFVAHGRHDQVVPFPGGQRLGQLLERHGFDVTFRAFEGGHEIPAPVLDALERFLFHQNG